MEWNLALIYPSYENFLEDLEKFNKSMEEVEKLKGKLHNEEGLLAYDEKYGKAEELLEKLFTYAYMRFDLNQKDTS